MDEITPVTTLCCYSYFIDSHHDADCPTTDGTYRCEECDLPFVRTDPSTKRCLFCRGTGLPAREF